MGRLVSEFEPRQPRNFLLRPALLGEVGAYAAETQKTAALIEDRVPGQGPVNILFARRAHHHVGEGEARRQMEAESLALLDHIGGVSIDRKQIRELAAEQLAGLALEVFGKLPRHVG